MNLTGDELDHAVTRAKSGDRQAVADILESVRPLVVRYCRARVGAGEGHILAADDIAQEVCIAVMAALPRYEDQGRPFMAFVYGIAAHKVADAHRASGRNKSDPVDELPELLSTDDGPEQAAIKSDAENRMHALLRTLPQMQREIVVLRLIVGLSADETAETLGTSAGAVRVAQHRALAKLRKHVTKEGEGLGKGA